MGISQGLRVVNKLKGDDFMLESQFAMNHPYLVTLIVLAVIGLAFYFVKKTFDIF